MNKNGTKTTMSRYNVEDFNGNADVDDDDDVGDDA